MNYAAFKVLPNDPARIRRESSAISDMHIAMSDEMQSAATCREAVDLIVDRIWRACEDAGGAQGENFVVQKDVVRCVFMILGCTGPQKFFFQS